MIRLLFAISFLIPLVSESQTDSLYETSRLEKMVMEAGRFTLVKTDTLGSTNDVHVGILTANDLLVTKKRRSICFIASNSGFNSIIFSVGNTQIDITDLHDFITALQKMTLILHANSPVGRQRFQYLASNLTGLSMENHSVNISKWDIVIYKRYKYLNSAVPGSELFIKEKNLEDLLEILRAYESRLGDDLYK